MKHIKTKRSKTRPQTVADRIRSNAEEQAQIDLSRIAISYNSPQPEKMHANAFLQNHHIYIKDQNPATLAHEFGHIIQRSHNTIPVSQRQLGKSVNQNHALEKEADMYAEGLLTNTITFPQKKGNTLRAISQNVIQFQGAEEQAITKTEGIPRANVVCDVDLYKINQETFEKLRSARREWALQLYTELIAKEPYQSANAQDKETYKEDINTMVSTYVTEQTGVMKCEEAADMIYTNLRRQINFKKTMFYCSVIPYIESHQRPSLEHAIIITSSKDIKPFLSKADSCGYSILTDPNEILKNALVLDGWRHSMCSLTAFLQGANPWTCVHSSQSSSTSKLFFKVLTTRMAEPMFPTFLFESQKQFLDTQIQSFNENNDPLRDKKIADNRSAYEPYDYHLQKDGIVTWVEKKPRRKRKKAFSIV